jgi:hypothetical protein
MDWFDLLIISLATVYVSVNLADAYTSGPWNTLDKLRRWAGVTYNELGNAEATPGSLGDMILCPYCNSVWIAIILTGVYMLFLWLALPAGWLFAPLAAAGIVVIVQELKTR